MHYPTFVEWLWGLGLISDDKAKESLAEWQRGLDEYERLKAEFRQNWMEERSRKPWWRRWLSSRNWLSAWLKEKRWEETKIP